MSNPPSEPHVLKLVFFKTSYFHNVCLNHASSWNINIDNHRLKAHQNEPSPFGRITYMKPLFSYYMKIIVNDLGYPWILFWHNIVYHMLKNCKKKNHMFISYEIIRYNVYRYNDKNYDIASYVLKIYIIL